jgi:hypothetical protein
VVAEIISAEYPHVAYFPSYKIITGHHHGYAFFETDLRSIRPEGVGHVMSLFKKHYLGVSRTNDDQNLTAVPPAGTGPVEMLDDLFKVVCDEEAIER